MNVISTNKAPAAIGPYSQGMIFGNLVFTSGQLPIDVTTGVMPVGIAAQAEESCKNVAAILHQAGTGPENTIKTTCFLSDIRDKIKDRIYN